MKHFTISSIAFLLCLLTANTIQAQDSAQKSTQLTGIAKQIADKDLTFIADWTIPSNQPIKEVTEVNYVKIMGDSIAIFLPYIGDVTTPTMGAQNTVSLDVQSHIKDYSISARAKGGVDILIALTDQLDIQSLLLTVFSDGSAYLNVNSRGRASISYKGQLEDKK